MSTLRLSERVPKDGRICMSTEKWLNLGEYRKMVESGRVPGKGGIRASTLKLSGPIRKNGRIGVSTEKLLNPGEYRQKVESVRVPKNCSDQYGKIVE